VSWRIFSSVGRRGRPDEKDPTILRARKIDVIWSDEELEAKYGGE
jgi:hypothetical protein